MKMAPTNYAYTRHMLKRGANGNRRGNHCRGPALRMDLLRGRQSFATQRSAEDRAPLPRLAHAIRLAGVCRGATMDAGEGGRVGENAG